MLFALGYIVAVLPMSRINQSASAQVSRFCSVESLTGGACNLTRLGLLIRENEPGVSRYEQLDLA